MAKRKVILFLVLVLIVGSLITGCGGKTEDTSKNSAEQVINMPLIDEPDSLDTARSSDIYTMVIAEQISEGLTRIEVDENDEKIIKPALAESWEVSENELEWTFTLRDAEWSDGEKINAEQFVYGIKRIVDPATASPISTNLKFIKNAQAIIDGDKDISEIGVEAIDEKNLKISLEYPSPFFLELTADRTMHPIREDIVEKHGDSYGTEADKLIFCGPFVLDEWVHNSKLTLSKNENYWDKDAVKLEKVNIKIIGEETARMGELESAGLDFAVVDSAEWIEKFDQEEDKYVKNVKLLPRTHYIFFNQEVKLFSNAKVRSAFNIVTNREEIEKDLLEGLHLAAYGWVAPPIEVDGDNFRQLAGDPIKELIDENPDPKALLIEGLRELGLNEDPSKHTVEFMLPGTTSEEKEFGEYLQEVYSSQLGINIVLDPVEWPVFQERNRQLKYEMGFKDYGGGINDPSFMLDLWISGTMTVPTGWSNPEYDKLVKEASSSLNSDLRKDNFIKAEKILLKEDSVIIPYAYEQSITYVHKHVKNLIEPDFGLTVLKYAYIEK